MAKSKRQQEFEMYGILAVMLVFFSVVLFALFWITKPDTLVTIYSWIRRVEFLGLWETLFPQARRLLYEAENNYYSLLTLAKSSLPSALLSGIGIATIGALAFSKVSTEHLDSYITHKEPPNMRTILKRFALFRPGVQFVLDYSVYPLSSARGDGRLPYNPLTFLSTHGLIRRIGKPAEWEDPDVNVDFPEPLPFLFLDVDDAKVRQFMAGTFGPRNPFLDLPNLTDPKAIQAAVDQLPWYLVVVLAPALARIHYSIFYEEKAYVDAVLGLHKFPDRVWMDLNKLKKIEGDRLRLGFDDDKHRASENSLWHERNAAKGAKKKTKGKGTEAKDLITLAEYLGEIVTENGREVPRAETLPSVKEARRLLLETLTLHLMDDRKAYPVGQDEKGRFVWKATPPSTAAEKAYLDKVLDRLLRASDECNKLMHGNAFAFGMFASVIERTRKMGVFHPVPWRWMRFIEPFHWRFFLDLGKPISTVDSMGMWEHYHAEKAIGAPVHEPFLRRTPNDLKRQAARFIDKEFVRRFNAMGAVDDAAESINMDTLFSEIDRADAQREADDVLREQSLAVELDDFDPSAVFASTEKPLTVKRAGKRVVQ